MNQRALKIHCHKNFAWNAIEFHLVYKMQGEEHLLLQAKDKEAKWITYDNVCEPSFRLTFEEASELMTKLWREGVRPNEKLPDETVVAAKEEHITDLRKMLGLDK